MTNEDAAMRLVSILNKIEHRKIRIPDFEDDDITAIRFGIFELETDRTAYWRRHKMEGKKGYRYTCTYCGKSGAVATKYCCDCGKYMKGIIRNEQWMVSEGKNTTNTGIE